MKILIGYDGSAGARAALDDLRRTGLPPDSEALVVSAGGAAMDGRLASYEIVERAPTTLRAAPVLALISRLHDEAEEQAAEAARLVRLLFPDWAVSAEGLSGEPSEAILERANEWGPDLVVLGSTGRSAIGRALLGSVSKRVAAEAPSSVRIARRVDEKRDGAPVRIIIGVDRSLDAERAVRAVGRRMWPRGTEVRLIAVDGDGSNWGSDIRTTSAQISSALEAEATMTGCEELRQAAEELKDRGLSVTVELLRGDARRVLIEEARLWEADSIFIGARGWQSRPGESGLGSVATHAAIHAPSSVEVVR